MVWFETSICLARLQEEKSQREQMEAKLSKAQRTMDEHVASVQSSMAAKLAAEVELRKKAEAELSSIQQQVQFAKHPPTLLWPWYNCMPVMALILNTYTLGCCCPAHNFPVLL